MWPCGPWRARNQNKHGDDLANFKPWIELRQGYGDAVKYLGSVGINLPDRDQLRSAKRVQMQEYIDKADDIRASSSMLAHITVNGESLTSEEQRARQQERRDLRRKGARIFI